MPPKISPSARGPWTGGFSDGTTLWFLDLQRKRPSGCLPGERPKQTGSGRYNPCRSCRHHYYGGSVYANGIAWFVEPDDDTAIAFVDPDYVASNVYIGSNRITKAYVGSTEVDRIYVGSTRVF